MLKGGVMKKNIIVFIAFMIFFYFSACKSTEEEISQFTLTVTVGEGVSGSPESGTFIYDESEVVTYDYSALDGYGNLIVTLDDAGVASSGTITMTGNHTLNVTADIDIRGVWIGSFYAGSTKYYMDTTFSGEIFSGPAQARISHFSGKGNGLFSVSGDQIDFTLQWTSVELRFTGTITGVSQMSGDWNVTGLAGIPAAMPKGIPGHGTWELER
jgi:hypothetical protein